MDRLDNNIWQRSIRRYRNTSSNLLLMVNFSRSSGISKSYHHSIPLPLRSFRVSKITMKTTFHSLLFNLRYISLWWGSVDSNQVDMWISLLVRFTQSITLRESWWVHRTTILSWLSQLMTYFSSWVQLLPSTHQTTTVSLALLMVLVDWFSVYGVIWGCPFGSCGNHQQKCAIEQFCDRRVGVSLDRQKRNDWRHSRHQSTFLRVRKCPVPSAQEHQQIVQLYRRYGRKCQEYSQGDRTLRGWNPIQSEWFVRRDANRIFQTFTQSCSLHQDQDGLEHKRHQDE